MLKVMANRYYVTIPSDDSVYGPYSWISATSFGRIGSQHGGPRVIFRRLHDEPVVVREYTKGKRSFPVAFEDFDELWPSEIPKEL